MYLPANCIKATPMKDKYTKDGFVVLEQDKNWQALKNEICYQFTRIFTNAAANKIPAALCWNIGEPNKIQKIDTVHMLSHSVYRLIFSPSLIQYIINLTGAHKIQLNSSHLFFKPAHSGNSGNVGWHTDYKNSRCNKLNIIVACIPLNPISKHSGNMKFVKGSHLWSGNTEHDFNDGAPCDLELQTQKLVDITPDNVGYQEVYAYSNNNEFSIHNGNTWHCSGPNSSDVFRLSLSISLHIQTDAFGYCLPDNVRNPIIYNKSYL